MERRHKVKNSIKYVQLGDYVLEITSYGNPNYMCEYRVYEYETQDTIHVDSMAYNDKVIAPVSMRIPDSTITDLEEFTNKLERVCYDVINAFEPATKLGIQALGCIFLYRDEKVEELERLFEASDQDRIIA